MIVDVALALLADVPLAKLTTRMIAKRVGVTQPALFRHFRSRDALLLAVVVRMRSELGDLAASVLEGDDDGPSRLMKVAMGLVAHVERYPGLPRLLFSDVQLGSEELRAGLAHLVSMQIAFASELVRAGQREGKITRRHPANLQGSAFMGLLQGIILQWQLQDRRHSLPDRAKPSLAMLLDGMAPLPDEPRDVVKVAPATPTATPTATPAATPAATPTATPTATSLRSLDVGPLLEKGEDPLETVLAALVPDGLLLLSTPFHPKPLVRLLESKGYGITVSQYERSSFELEIRGPAFPDIEDLRSLEPPLPLERILTASASLADGARRAYHVPRFPALLVGRLDERSISWETVACRDGTAILVICHQT